MSLYLFGWDDRLTNFICTFWAKMCIHRKWKLPSFSCFSCTGLYIYIYIWEIVLLLKKSIKKLPSLPHPNDITNSAPASYSYSEFLYIYTYTSSLLFTLSFTLTYTHFFFILLSFFFVHSAIYSWNKIK